MTSFVMGLFDLILMPFGMSGNVIVFVPLFSLFFLSVMAIFKSLLYRRPVRL